MKFKVNLKKRPFILRLTTCMPALLLLASFAAQPSITHLDTVTFSDPSNEVDEIATINFNPGGDILSAISWFRIQLFLRLAGQSFESLGGLQSHGENYGYKTPFAWHYEGRVFATLMEKNTIGIFSFDGEKSELLHTIPILGRPVIDINDLVFKPYSDILVCAGSDGKIIFYRLNKNSAYFLDAIEPNASPGVASILSIAWYPEENVLVSGGPDGTISFYRFEEDKAEYLHTIPREMMGTGSTIVILTINPADNTLLSVHSNGTLNFWRWDGASATLITSMASTERDDAGSRIKAATWHPYNNTLAIAPTKTGIIRFYEWDGQNANLFKTIVPGQENAHRDAVVSLAWHPQGELIASGSADDTIKLWDFSEHFQKRFMVSKKAHSL